MNAIVGEKLKLLPEQPGVYKMLNSLGEVIYVGKAVNLKNRVRQYFQAGKKQAKVAAMVSHIADFEYILTHSETEALTLESNLIKSFQPRYNILLKDDKHFPYVRVDLRQDFPRFEVVRRVEKDGARYFGPYLSGLAIKEALNVVREYFPVRHCKKDIPRAIARGERPCLMYHVGKCCAPCSGNVSRQEYHELLQSVCRYLEGHTGPVVELLTKRMQQAAEAMEFERAAQLRDRIAAIRAMGQKQQAITASTMERDVFAFVKDGADAVVFGLFMRNGKVVGTRRMAISCGEEGEDEVMASFLQQYYSGSGYVPKEVVVKDLPEGAAQLERWLCELRGSRVQLVCPKRGEKLTQAEMAYANGKDAILKARELEHREWERSGGALIRLSELLELELVPGRIECFDNSHIHGRDSVGSMVVFLDGVPAPGEYRRFKIKAAAAGDDYLAMREVLTRRLERAKSGDAKFAVLPDLIIVDGGRGQLGVALEVLAEEGLCIPAVGLAERNEELYLPGCEQPLVLEKRDMALHLVQRIRDEAHRFALTYHRSLRQKNALFSVLEEVQGVGPKRRRALFESFVSLSAIKAASVEELAAVKGMSKTAAQAVFNHFNNGAEKRD